MRVLRQYLPSVGTSYPHCKCVNDHLSLRLLLQEDCSNNEDSFPTLLIFALAIFQQVNRIIFTYFFLICLFVIIATSNELTVVFDSLFCSRLLTFRFFFLLLFLLSVVAFSP